MFAVCDQRQVHKEQGVGQPGGLRGDDASPISVRDRESQETAAAGQTSLYLKANQSQNISVRDRESQETTAAS